MKNLKLLVLLLTLTGIANAQTDDYVPFPTENAKWEVIHHYGGIYSYERTTYTHEIKHDTIIDEILYHALYINNDYTAALREEDKRVFVNFPTFGEHLLYDFNLEVGDTIFYSLAGFPPSNDFDSIEHYRIISSIDSVQLFNGEFRKRWNCYSWSNMIIPAISYIEGIGDVYNCSLFGPFILYYADDFSQWNLLCFHQDNTLIYLNSECRDCDCHIPPGFSVEENNVSSLTLFPNPAKTIIQVCRPENCQGIGDIRIYNSFGQLVYQNASYSWDASINIAHLSDGFYIMNCSVKDKIYKSSFVINK